MSKSDRQPLLPTHRLAQGRISFPSSSTSALDPDSASTLVDADAAAPSRKPPRSRSGNQDGSLAVPKAKRQGLPKLSRECLWSEIKCYGSYILPVFLVFGVLVVGVSLGVVGWKKGRFS